MFILRNDIIYCKHISMKNLKRFSSRDNRCLFSFRWGYKWKRYIKADVVCSTNGILYWWRQFDSLHSSHISPSGIYKYVSLNCNAIFNKIIEFMQSFAEPWTVENDFNARRYDYFTMVRHKYPHLKVSKYFIYVFRWWPIFLPIKCNLSAADYFRFGNNSIRAYGNGTQQSCTAQVHRSSFQFYIAV